MSTKGSTSKGTSRSSTNTITGNIKRHDNALDRGSGASHDDSSGLASAPPNNAKATSVNRSTTAHDDSNSSNNIRKNDRMVINEEFFDDFDDDDDAFFASTSGIHNDNIIMHDGSTGTVGNNEGNISASSPGAAGKEPVPSSATAATSASSFGMLTFSYYSDALSSTAAERGSNARQSFPAPRPNSPTNNNISHGSTMDTAEDAFLGQEGDVDDAELLELDRRHLTHLRNPNSPYRIVARSCLAINQLAYSADSTAGTEQQLSSDGASPPMQIESSCIFHIQQYQRLTHRIITSLSTCISSHESPSCRSLACRTLATVARASYARLRFDAKLMSVRLPASVATQLEDECGNGTAYTLLVAALEQGNDAVSSAALESLGRLTLDPHNDDFAAEVKGIAECSNSSCVFMYDHGSKSCWIMEHAHAMRELQSRAWSNVVFPRMQRILHRVSLYSCHHHLAKAIPVIAAACVHAMAHGPDTIPARRAMQTSKSSHGKRGWMETDAERLVKEFVEGILLPCFQSHDLFSLGNNNMNSSDKGLQRAAALACIRLSSVCPLAPWRVLACRCAVTTLLQQLNEEMGLASPSTTKLTWQSSFPTDRATGKERQGASVLSPMSSTLSTATVPVEALAGTAAMLVIALRGIPLRERTPGLVAVLRASLLFLPLGTPIPCGGMVQSGGNFDVPISFVPAEDNEGVGKRDQIAHRLGRTGLLAEVAISIMLDGDTNIDHLVTEESHDVHVNPNSDIEKEAEKEKIVGTRPILLNHILQSHHLAAVWDSLHKKYHVNANSEQDSNFEPADELVWVFCSVALQIGKQREDLFSKDMSSAIEWSNLGLVLLDNFSKYLCNHHHRNSSTKGTPRTFATSPFANSAHTAYVTLFAVILQRSGSFPPSSLSVSQSMLPTSLSVLNYPAILTSFSGRRSLSVIGGPGKQLPRVSLILSKITHAMLSLWNKSRHANLQGGDDVSMEARAKNALLTLLIVDAWSGRCIMNHDAKQSNDAQLEMSPMLLSLFHSEMDALLDSRKGADEDIAAHLFRVYIACVEMVACMSTLMLRIDSRQSDDGVIFSDKKVGPLALSILSGLAIAVKEGLGSEEIAADATDAVARIQNCTRNSPQSYHEDIATALKVSPLLSRDDRWNGKLSLQAIFNRLFIGAQFSGNYMKEIRSTEEELIITKLSSSSDSKLNPIEQCSFFLFHHARLVLLHRSDVATKAHAITTATSLLSASKQIHPRNVFRLQSAFTHSTIASYQRLRDLPLLLPSKSSRSSGLISGLNVGDNLETVCLTGSSDPVTLTMSCGVRQVRKSNLSEDAMLIVTLRLYNITPVPIRNGVRLDLKFTQEHCFDDGSTCSSSSVHKNEIKGGDYVTWEVVLGNWRVGSISLQAAVTFRDMEQESSTHKWVSGGERDDTHAITGEGAYIMDDEDEAIVDFTINCEPVTISPIASLQPCPLTFFGGIQRCVPDVGLGDTAAFCFLWSTMIFSCKISFVSKSSQIGDNGGPRSLVDPKKGYVILDDIDGKGNNSSHTTSGCAFVTPDGNRILCTLAANSEEKESKTSSLLIRSDSFIALLSFVGTPELQTSFLTFVLGDDVDIVNTRSRHVSVDSSRPNSGHDFPSMTMNHSPINLSAQQPIFGHDFPSMTMGPVPTVDAS